MTSPARLFCVALLALTAPAFAETPQEATMRAAIDADQPRNIALLERAVNQNSGTLNLPGVRAVGDIFRPEFEALGFQVRWVDQSAVGRAGHLIASHRGSRTGKRILLIGHLDTVFEKESPFQTFVRTGDKAVGPGVGDMKGGDVVIIAALRAMQAAGTLKNANVEVHLVGDEERTGTPLDISRKDLIEAGKRSDVALEYENLASYQGKEYGTIARRSAMSWTLTTTGVTGHSSGVGQRDSNWGAIYEMARILDAFRRELPEENATFNVGVVAGGTPAELAADQFHASAAGKTNIIAAQAVARGDLRTLTPEQDVRIRAKMQAIVAQHLKTTGATLEFGDSYPPMAPTEGNRALLAKLNQANTDLGLPVMDELEPSRRGAADSGFVAAYTDTLGGLGIDGGGAHAEGEDADLDSIRRQALRSAVLISRLAKEHR